MESLKTILLELKKNGAIGIKISFEDEGAQLNEMITMRTLTSSINLEMSIKIGGCEAKRDIIDCIILCADSIVAPMVESSFALKKFKECIKQVNYNGKIGFNLETINSYNNLDNLIKNLDDIDFVTFGRVDFVSSLNQSRNIIDSDIILQYVTDAFNKIKTMNKLCYLGGGINVNSINFIGNLINSKLLDKFETRYIIFNVEDIINIEQSLYLANLFEVEWLKYISERYNTYAFKDLKRIQMIEDRLDNYKKIKQ